MLPLSVVAVALLTGVGFSTIGLGLWVSYGRQKIVDIANVGFLLLAAYAMFALSTVVGLDVTVAMLLVAPISAIVGFAYFSFLLERFQRRAHLESALFTFGTLFVLEGLMQYIWKGDLRTLNAPYLSASYHVGALTLSSPKVISASVGLGLGVAMMLLFRFTLLGKIAEAVCVNPTRAQLLGIDTFRVNGLLYGLATFCAAAGGYVVGITVSFQPSDTLQWFVFGFTLMTLAQSLGPLGIVAIAAALQLFQSAIGYYFGGWEGIATYVLLLAVMVVRPSFVFGRDAQFR